MIHPVILIQLFQKSKGHELNSTILEIQSTRMKLCIDKSKGTNYKDLRKQQLKELGMNMAAIAITQLRKGQLPIQSTDTPYHYNLTRNAIIFYPISHCKSITIAAYYEERKLSQNHTTK